MRIGVFGGSFDPIHHGHLIAAEALADALALDEVRLVVAKEQPLKAVGHAAPANDRASMVEIAVRGAARLVADRSELARAGPSYTVDTLRGFHTRWPEAELVLLVGTDAADALPRWRQIDAVRALATLAVFARGESGRDRGAVTVPRLEISSTEIRERVRTGRSIRYWVPDAVAAYIARGRLYLDD